MSRTFAIGDIHGDLEALTTLLARLPDDLSEQDTIVFLGDYVDSGPDSAGVVAFLRAFPATTPAEVVILRGNHEDAWLKVIDEGFDGFVFPKSNGTRACLRSFLGLDEEADTMPHIDALFTGSFFPDDVVEWMRSLPFYYEDQHAIYVHAGLKKENDRWLHPDEVTDPTVLLWTRTPDFFVEYIGKPVIVGHTGVSHLPEGVSLHTPDDPDDMFWAGRSAFAIDTACGKGGFLSCLELPAYRVYESR